MSNRIPDHAALWSRLPLPYTPAEAWELLPSHVRAAIGTAAIEFALATYVSGDAYAMADRFLDDALRDRAADAAGETLLGIEAFVSSRFPELFGLDGDHPAWALEGGFAR